MLRDNFPKTKEEAKKFDVEIRDAIGIFKIFEHNETIEKTINEVNTFLVKNGYDRISIDEFLANENSYISEDEIVSLSLHSYKEALVLFVEKEAKSQI